MSRAVPADALIDNAANSAGFLGLLAIFNSFLLFTLSLL